MRGRPAGGAVDLAPARACTAPSRAMSIAQSMWKCRRRSNISRSRGSARRRVMVPNTAPRASATSTAGSAGGESGSSSPGGAGVGRRQLRQRPAFLLGEEGVDDVLGDRRRRGGRARRARRRSTPAICGLSRGAKNTNKPWSRRSSIGALGGLAALVGDHLRGAGLARHVVAGRSGRGRPCPRRSRPSTARRAGPAASRA